MPSRHSATLWETNAAIEEMRREHDPLASHIFVSRRNYRNVHDTKAVSGITCQRGSVGSRRAILDFVAISESGSDCWGPRPSGEGASAQRQVVDGRLA